MATQEEIREGLAAKLASFEDKDYWRMTDVDKEYWLTKAYSSLQYLHSQGVVIKIDRELPDNPYKRKPRVEGFDLDYDSTLDIVAYFTQQDMLKVGYVAVESLVKK